MWQVSLIIYSQPHGIRWWKHNSFCPWAKKEFVERILHFLSNTTGNGSLQGLDPGSGKLTGTRHWFPLPPLFLLAHVLIFIKSCFLGDFFWFRLSPGLHHQISGGDLSATQLSLPPQLQRKILWLLKVTACICTPHPKLHLPRWLPFASMNKMVPLKGHSLNIQHYRWPQLQPLGDGSKLRGSFPTRT